MNTYRIGGKYQLWENEEIGREPFTCIVLARTTEDAIRICQDNYRNAEIISTLLRDEDVKTEKAKETPAATAGEFSDFLRRKMLDDLALANADAYRLAAALRLEQNPGYTCLALQLHEERVGKDGDK